VVYSSQFSTSISMFGASTPFCLTAPPTPALFGVFAFHHRRSLFSIGVCTSLIKCFCNSSFSILACIGKVFACCLHQEHKRLLVVQTLIVSALSFIWEHFFSLHLLSHYSTSLDPTGTPAQSPCALVQFLFSRFLSIPCLCLTAAHPVITPIQVKIGCQSLSPCCISLLLSRSSSILPLRKHSHRVLLFWRNHHSIRSLNIRNPTVPLCSHPASLQPFHYKLLYIRK